MKALGKYAATAGQLVKAMEKDGLVDIFEKRVYRDPFGDAIEPDIPPVLTAEQATAVDAVLESLGNGFLTYLLVGVTGSGKTEVYLKAAAAAIERGESVLVLVPEIALISQMEYRFRGRFGEVLERGRRYLHLSKTLG